MLQSTPWIGGTVAECDGQSFASRLVPGLRIVVRQTGRERLGHKNGAPHFEFANCSTLKEV